MDPVLLDGRTGRRRRGRPKRLRQAKRGGSGRSFRPSQLPREQATAPFLGQGVGAGAGAVTGGGGSAGTGVGAGAATLWRCGAGAAAPSWILLTTCIRLMIVCSWG